MAVSVRVETTIGRPRAETSAFVMDPSHDLEWIGALTEVTVMDPGPVQVGTRVQRIAQFLGKRIEYVNRIDELVPERRLAMHSVKAPFDMRVTYSFADAEDGATRVSVEAGGETGGYYRLAGPLLPFFVKAGIRRDLRNLKRVLEQRGQSS